MAYIGRHRAEDDEPEHVMEFWQRHCLWHATCSCRPGHTATGDDGAQAMSRIKHRAGGVVPNPPVGYGRERYVERVGLV